jgi:NAD(P)H dehydrogenase (quinone)
MPQYAVTGASGQLGRKVVDELLDRGVPPFEIVAIVRRAQSVRDFANRGVQVREADYGEPDTLVRALIGIRRLLLISGNTAGQRTLHHANAINAARVGGVTRIVYTSMLNLEESSNPLIGEHRETERALQESGIQHVVLRNGWYTENYTNQISQYILTGQIVAAAGDGRISAATRADFAAAAAVALLDNHHENKIYELGGDAFDLYELANLVTDAANKPVTYAALSSAEYIQQLQANGLDEPTARFIAELDASVARGELETTSEDLAGLLGRRPTGLAQLVPEAVAATHPST